MPPGIPDPTQPFAPMPNGGADAAAGFDPLAVSLVLVAYLAVSAAGIAIYQMLLGSEVPV